MNAVVKKIFKWTLLTLLLAYMTVITVWAGNEASRHTVKGIDIEIATATTADSITRSGILSELSKYPRKIVGAKTNNINTLDIERYLGRLSAFEDVKCVLTSQGRLKVLVRPMIPEIRVFDTDGRSYYVNKDGKRIATNAEFFVDVPVVQGHFTKTFPATDILPVTRFVAADPDLSTIVAFVKAESPDNILLVPRLRGHVINIGDTTRLNEKRVAILTAYHSVLPRKGWERYDTISVKFRDRIVASRRDKTTSMKYLPDPDEVDLEETTLPEADRQQEETETKPQN